MFPAIVRDATSTGSGTSVTSVTVAHTCAAGAALFVHYFADVSATTCTYNGVSMTLIAERSNSGSQFIGTFYLANPATGANNIILSIGSSSNISGVVGNSYTGGNTLTIDNHTEPVVGNSVPFTTSLTTTNANCWGILVVRDLATGVSAAGTGSTLRINFGGFQVYDTNGTLAAGSNSMAVANASAHNVETAMFAFVMPSTASASDTQGSTDTVTALSTVSISDTQGSTDTTRAKILPANTSKNSSTWSNTQKS